jgi:hypothetical protein
MVITISIVQRPSQEAYSASASQENSPFMEPKGSILCSQEPATGPYPKPYDSIQHPPTPFLQDSL